MVTQGCESSWMLCCLGGARKAQRDLFLNQQRLSVCVFSNIVVSALISILVGRHLNALVSMAPKLRDS